MEEKRHSSRSSRCIAFLHPCHPRNPRFLHFEQRSGMLEGGFAPAAEHPCDFFLARFAFDGVQPRKRASMRHLFGHNEMSRGERGHLRQMRDAQHLVASGQRAHFGSDRVGNFTPDIRIDLIEDEERDGILQREG